MRLDSDFENFYFNTQLMGLLIIYCCNLTSVVNKSMMDRLVKGGIMKQTFGATIMFLDKVTKICKAWYTYEDYASFTKGEISKEQLAKEKERDEVIGRMVK